MYWLIYNFCHICNGKKYFCASLHHTTCNSDHLSCNANVASSRWWCFRDSNIVCNKPCSCICISPIPFCLISIWSQFVIVQFYRHSETQIGFVHLSVQAVVISDWLCPQRSVQLGSYFWQTPHSTRHTAGVCAELYIPHTQSWRMHTKKLLFPDNVNIP